MTTQIKLIIRHSLTFGGGLLVGKDILPAEALPELIAGLMTLIGVVWSVLDKKKA